MDQKASLVGAARQRLRANRRGKCEGLLIGLAEFVVIVAMLGCTKEFRVPVSPAEAESRGEVRSMRVTLWIDPQVTQATARPQFSYRPWGSMRVVVPYGDGLTQTIQRAARKAFAAVEEGKACANGSSLLVRVEWAGEPTVFMTWDAGIQEGARGQVEFPLRVAAVECGGGVLVRRNVVGAYVGPGAPPGAWNLPGADDFSPIVAAALQDTGNKLVAVFASLPGADLPAEQGKQKEGE